MQNQGTEDQQCAGLAGEVLGDAERLRHAEHDLTVEFHATYRRLEAVRLERHKLVARALRGRFSREDVTAWLERSTALDEPKVGQQTLADLCWSRQVPNAPLREAYERSDVPEIARKVRVRLAKMERDDDANYGSCAMTRKALEGELGIEPVLGVGTTWHMAYEPAAALADVLGADIIDVAIRA
jgi:hypothetical protein